MEDLEDVNFTLSVLYVLTASPDKIGPMLLLAENCTGQGFFQQTPDRCSFLLIGASAQGVRCHCEEIAGDIFDKLLTFTDFLAFKEMFLDYKAEKEGRTVDLSCGLVVTPLISSSVSSSYYSCCYSFIVLSTFCTYFSM